MIYASSSLKKGSRYFKVLSAYVHDESSPRYVVRVLLMRGGHIHYSQERARFTHFKLASDFHNDQVMTFILKGYRILNSESK